MTFYHAPSVERISTEHQSYLQRRAVRLDVAAAAGVYSTDQRGASQLLGFRAPSGGLVFPQWQNGNYVQIRMDVVQRDVKFLSPRGLAPEVYYPFAIPSERPVIVAEGPCKALALWSAGLPAMSVRGVATTLVKGSSPPQLHDSWHVVGDLDGRDVRILYDSDIYTNPRVQHGAARLSVALTREGAIPRFARFQSEGKLGPDDLLASGRIQQVLSALETAHPAEPERWLRPDRYQSGRAEVPREFLESCSWHVYWATGYALSQLPDGRYPFPYAFAALQDQGPDQVMQSIYHRSGVVRHLREGVMEICRDNLFAVCLLASTIHKRAAVESLLQTCGVKMPWWRPHLQKALRARDNTELKAHIESLRAELSENVSGQAFQRLLRKRGVKFQSKRFWQALAELPPEPAKAVRTGKRSKVKDDDLQERVANVLASRCRDLPFRALAAVLRSQGLRFSAERLIKVRRAAELRMDAGSRCQGWALHWTDSRRDHAGAFRAV